MTRWIKIIAAFAAGVVLVGVARLAWVESRRTEGPILRNYEVPQDIAQEVRDALSGALSAMSKDGDRIGTVIVAPSGQLIVTASPEVQLGVHKIIEDIKARKLPPTPTVSYDVWIVTGTPVSGASRDGKVPAELAPAIDSLRKARGDLKFGLLEHLSTSSRSGREKSSVAGAKAQVTVESRLQTGVDGKARVAAEIEITGHAPFVPGRPQETPFGLRSQVTLVPGELLVIGQSLSRVPTEDDQPQEVYFIVRATL
jgi:hypothetical protein